MGRVSTKSNDRGGPYMNHDKFDVQTLSGMSIGSLRAHYRQVKEQYLELSGRDTRVHSYLSNVDGFIQMREQEEKANKQSEVE
jgi:hypothetical protein